MFIAHLPAGYLLTKAFEIELTEYDISWKIGIFIGLLGSILPDLDLFYFYLIDGRQHQHHSYWTHIPIYWFYIYIVSACIFFVTKNKKMLLITTFLFIQIILHLILDTVAGGILWSYPLSNHYFVLFDVTAQYNWWVLNFMFHWSFVLEVLITFSALSTLIKSNKAKRSGIKLLKSEA